MTPPSGSFARKSGRGDIVRIVKSHRGEIASNVGADPDPV